MADKSWETKQKRKLEGERKLTPIAMMKSKERGRKGG